MDFLVWLESTSLASWVRESPSLLAYPTVLFMHTLGMSIVAGLSSAVDLRIIGIGRDVPISPLQRLYPYMWLGFLINLFSGSLLLVADATTKFVNPVFYVKMIFVILAVIDLKVMRTKVFGDPLLDKRPVSSTGKLLAYASLVCWAGAVTAGRLMAYLGPVGGLN
jgi:hypothetical protein